MMILDPEAIRQIDEYAANFDPAVFNEIMNEYILESRKLVQELETAFQQQNDILLERTAHTLKGQAATLGAPAFAALCRELELASHSGNLEGAQDLVNRIKHECSEYELALYTEIEHKSSTHRSE